MFWLEENLILSNVLITGKSNFDEKNVEEVFNLCSTEQGCIYIGITCYKISTLGGLSFFSNKIFSPKNCISQILVIVLKNRSNEIRSNEIRIRQELPVPIL